MMLHQISVVTDKHKQYITFTETENKTLKIRTGYFDLEDFGKHVEYDLLTEIEISKEKLHSMIGTLLHIQSKMK